MSMNRCTHCDYDSLLEEDDVCPSCGAPVRPASERTVWVIIAVVALLVVGGGFWAVSGSSPRQVSSPRVAAPPARPLSIADLVEEVGPGVVLIEVPGQSSQGSGWMWEQGLIITCAHVVGNATSVVIRADGGAQFTGTVVGTDAAYDVAVIRLHGGAGIRVLPVGDSEGTRQGDEVLAFGSPLGLDNSVTEGIISAIRSDVPVESMVLPSAFQVSAPIAPGSSGGPLIDRRNGAVIGMNAAGVRPDQAHNIGFAVPAEDVVRAARHIVGR
jgi:serine protease Do